MSQALEGKKGFSGKQVVGIILGVMLLTVVVTVFAIRSWLFPQPFSPVTLSQQEEQQLEQKLERLDSFTLSDSASHQDVVVGAGKSEPPPPDFTSDGKLTPQAWSDADTNREIRLTERELNGLLSNNTDLARKVAIDLSDDLISLRLLIPVDPDFPVMGGKTIRAKAGAEMAYRDERPVIILKGVSLMGVPIPNAWLGGLKNIDLVREFGSDQGFWKAFADGVEAIQVREGELYIKLKE